MRHQPKAESPPRLEKHASFLLLCSASGSAPETHFNSQRISSLFHHIFHIRIEVHMKRSKKKTCFSFAVSSIMRPWISMNACEKNKQLATKENGKLREKKDERGAYSSVGFVGHFQWNYALALLCRRFSPKNLNEKSRQ